MMTAKAESESRPGTAVDGRGNPAVDPTENVKALSEAANKRQDDLRVALKAEIDQHFATKHDHLVMLERRIDEHLNHIRISIKDHSESDLRGFDSIRNEIALHLAEDLRTHQSIMDLSMERMNAVKDLLQKSIESIDRAGRELAVNMTTRFESVAEWRQSTADALRLTQQNTVSSETFTEFRRTVEQRSEVFNNFMITNTGEKQGIKSLWGIVISAAIGGAAIISVFQFVVGHLGTSASAPTPTPTPQVIYAPAPPGTLIPSNPGAVEQRR